MSLNDLIERLQQIQSHCVGQRREASVLITHDDPHIDEALEIKEIEIDNDINGMECGAIIRLHFVDD